MDSSELLLQKDHLPLGNGVCALPYLVGGQWWLHFRAPKGVATGGVKGTTRGAGILRLDSGRLRRLRLRGIGDECAEGAEGADSRQKSRQNSGLPLSKENLSLPKEYSIAPLIKYRI